MLQRGTLACAIVDEMVNADETSTSSAHRSDEVIIESWSKSVNADEVKKAEGDSIRALFPVLYIIMKIKTICHSRVNLVTIFMQALPCQ